MELMVIMPRDIEPSCLFTTSCILSVKINAGNLFFGGVFSGGFASESCCASISMVKNVYAPLYLAYVMIGEGRKNSQQLSL